MEIEEICLQCGVDVFDGRPYCSQECERLDASSTSSSSFSSPHFDPAAAGHLPEVPALMPAALGSALRSATRYDRYAWSSISDDDDEQRIHIHDDADAKAHNPFGLMYARRPSGTNKPSTVAPTARARYPSTSEDDEGTGSSSPAAKSPRSTHRLQLSPKATPHTGLSPQTALADSLATITHPKRRNRASLPAYFQLLAVSPSAAPAPPQPQRVSPSSLRTPTAVLPASPPAPLTAVAPAPDAEALRGRGRKREPGEPSTASRTRSGRRSAEVSRERRQRRGRSESIEPGLGWLATDTSPPRAADAPAAGLYEADESELEFEFDFDAREHEQQELRRAQEEQAVREARRAREEDRRGRLRGRELDGPSDLNARAPGYGNGRSGLRDRASRDADRIGRSMRSPVAGLRA